MQYTTQTQVRKAFWNDNPMLSRKKIKDYAGTGTMYCTDTRCAFSDYVDMLLNNGVISEALANCVTL